MLLGEDRADQADDGRAVGEDAADVGPAKNFGWSPSRGLSPQMCRQWRLRKAVKAKSSGTPQGALNKVLDASVEAFAHGRNVGPVNGLYSETLDQPVDSARADAEDIEPGDDLLERLFRAAPALEEPVRKAGTSAQLRNMQNDRPHIGVPPPVTVAVALAAYFRATPARRRTAALLDLCPHELLDEGHNGLAHCVARPGSRSSCKQHGISATGGGLHVCLPRTGSPTHSYETA